MPRAFFQDGAFFAPGEFFEEGVPVTPPPPAVINLGAPGDAIYALPFRALGGSVIDLDLLYGLVGSSAGLEDIQPIFALATREGLIRAWGKEMPRQGIQDVCVETFATLKAVDDITLEGSPLGPNLFGSVGLSTLPTFRVTLDNRDGSLSVLMLRELIMYAPAGIFADIGHTVVSPVVTGTVTDIQSVGAQVVITGGISARPTKRGPSLPHLNLDHILELRNAGEYTHAPSDPVHPIPPNETEVLPEVFGNWLSTDVGEPQSPAVATKAVLIDEFNLVYCVNARRTDPSPPVVMWNGEIQDPSVYVWNPTDNYEGRGIIATLTFNLFAVTTGVVSVRHGGSLDGSGIPISNPIIMLYTMLTERAGWSLEHFDLGMCQQTRRDLDALGYPAHWVWDEEKSIREWMMELCPHYHCDFLETGNGQLAVILDRSLTALPVAPDYHVMSYEIEDEGSPATAIALELHSEDVVNQVTLKARYNWSQRETTVDYTWDYHQSQSAYLTAYPAEFTFRGMYTLGHATTWLHSFAVRHGIDPTLVSFTVRGLKGLPLIPSRLITVEWPPWGWSEHLLKIVRTTLHWEDRRVSLSCVDCQRELDETPDLPTNTPSLASRALQRLHQFIPGAVGDAGSLADAPTNTRNEAANGDCELGDNGQWDLRTANAAEQWTFVLNATEAHRGRYYLRSVPNVGNGTAVTLRKRIDPDEWVLASAWFAQYSGGTNGYAHSAIFFYDQDDVFLNQWLYGNYVPPLGSYYESVAFGQAPANAYYYRPGIGFDTYPTTGQWKADSLFAASGSQNDVLNSRNANTVVSRNPVINGDFNQGPVMWTGSNTFWFVTNNPGVAARSGLWYAAHEPSSSGIEDRLNSLTSIAVTPGQTFTFQAYGQTINGPNGFARLGVTWIDGQGNLIAENATPGSGGPLSGWTLASGQMTVPNGASIAHIWIGVAGHTGPANTFWAVDDVFIY